MSKQKKRCLSKKEKEKNSFGEWRDILILIGEYVDVTTWGRMRCCCQYLNKELGKYYNKLALNSMLALRDIKWHLLSKRFFYRRYVAWINTITQREDADYKFALINERINAFVFEKDAQLVFRLYEKYLEVQYPTGCIISFYPVPLYAGTIWDKFKAK